MGCAGSKQHHLSSSALNLPPQKGFIIFNAKTIEYIRANEEQLKSTIRERCELKLCKNGTLKSTTITSTKSAAQQQPVQAQVKLLNDTQLSILESTIDSILKYAINDFDIETFKSSNHLSMKQIKKDILKKQSSLHNTSNASTTLKSFSSNNDTSYYKKALSVSIDEFGSLMQEKVIEIDEFKRKQTDDEHIITDECPPNIPQIEITEAQVPTKTATINDNDSYTLKEALEIARRNFYSGKTSVVCTTNKGNYLVKEMKDSQMDDQQQTSLSNSSDDQSTPKMKTKTVTMFDTETKQTTKIAISHQIDLDNVNLSGNLQIIDTDFQTSPTPVVNKESNFMDRLKSGQLNELNDEFFKYQDKILEFIESNKFDKEKLSMLINQMNENQVNILSNELKVALLNLQIESITLKLAPHELNESLSDHDKQSSSFSSPSDLVSSASGSPVSKKEDSMESLNNENGYLGTKRLSIDEELLNRLEDVDKKVKYLTETCSENENDDDNNDDMFNRVDDDMLFNPTRTNTSVLQEEIKQISNVIQDLVQTINSSTSSTSDDKENFLLNENSKSSPSHFEDRQLQKERKSISSVNSTSNIPVSKTRLVQKQQQQRTITASTMPIEDEQQFINESQRYDDQESSFNNSRDTSSQDILSNSINSKKRFKSKLPVKK